MQLALNELDRLCDILPTHGILLLSGDLAMGKTTLVKALAKKHKISEDITSPTFSILQNYGENFFHYDIYQEKTQGFMQKGLYENLTKDGLHVVEWGDEEFKKMLKSMGFGYTCVDISQKEDKTKRYYEVSYA